MVRKAKSLAPVEPTPIDVLTSTEGLQGMQPQCDRLNDALSFLTELLPTIMSGSLAYISISLGSFEVAEVQ